MIGIGLTCGKRLERTTPSKNPVKNGRGGEIRTHDLLHPKQARIPGYATPRTILAGSLLRGNHYAAIAPRSQLKKFVVPFSSSNLSWLPFYDLRFAIDARPDVIPRATQSVRS